MGGQGRPLFLKRNVDKVLILKSIDKSFEVMFFNLCK